MPTKGMEKNPSWRRGAGLVGLIADSHGNFEATELAIDILQQAGVDQIVHLGDFCDTARRDYGRTVIPLLEENQILAVKGNNDFVVESILKERQNTLSPEEGRLRDFLKKIPTLITSDHICFAHSLPHDTIRAYYEPIDTGSTERAVQIFREMPYRILFCGHSHRPVLFRWVTGKITREQVPQGERLKLHPEERYIFVVGAVNEGECALYDAKEAIYQRIRIF